MEQKKSSLDLSVREFGLDQVSFHVSSHSGSEGAQSILDRIVQSLRHVETLKVLKLNVNDEKISSSSLACICYTNHLRELHLEGLAVEAAHFGVVARTLKGCRGERSKLTKLCLRAQ